MPRSWKRERYRCLQKLICCSVMAMSAASKDRSDFDGKAAVSIDTYKCSTRVAAKGFIVNRSTRPLEYLECFSVRVTCRYAAESAGRSSHTYPIPREETWEQGMGYLGTSQNRKVSTIHTYGVRPDYFD